MSEKIDLLCIFYSFPARVKTNLMKERKESAQCLIQFYSAEKGKVVPYPTGFMFYTLSNLGNVCICIRGVRNGIAGRGSLRDPMWVENRSVRISCRAAISRMIARDAETTMPRLSCRSQSLQILPVLMALLNRCES